jgi:hypothetical protein
MIYNFTEVMVKMKKTLKQVELETGLTRRQIQEYEKYGSEMDKDKNGRVIKSHKSFTISPIIENGILMYGELAVERLWQIRFYRELGYDKNEISKIFNDLNFDRKSELKKQIDELETKKSDIEAMIKMAKYYMNTDQYIWDCRYLKAFSTKCFDIIKMASSSEFEEYFSTIYEKMDGFTSRLEDKNNIERINKMIDLYHNKIVFNDSRTQSCVSDLYGSLKNSLNDSKLLFLILFTIYFWHLSADEEFENEEDRAEVKKGIEYLCNAVLYYFFNNLDSKIQFSIEQFIDNYDDGVDFKDNSTQMSIKDIWDRVIEIFDIRNTNSVTRCLDLIEDLIVKEKDNEFIMYLVNALKYLISA